MDSPRFHGVAAGDQLGNLEYLVDDPAAFEYRRLVGDHSSYVNLMADDCESMAAAKFRGVDLCAVWRTFEFLRPPILGRRIQVGGWLKDIGEARGQTRLRVSAFAVDEIGTEILRSEAAFMVGNLEARSRRVATNSPGRLIDPAESGFKHPVGDSFALGNWVAPEGEPLDSERQLRGDRSDALGQPNSNRAAQLLGGRLEGWLGWLLGDDFRWGGRISLAYQAPIAPGDVLTTDAVVIEHDQDHNGTRAVKLILTTYNERNETVSAGVASATMPSQRLI